MNAKQKNWTMKTTVAGEAAWQWQLVALFHHMNNQQNNLQAKTEVIFERTDEFGSAIIFVYNEKLLCALHFLDEWL